MFSTLGAFIDNGVFLGLVVILMLDIGLKFLPLISTQEAFKENGATAVSIASIAIALLFLGRVVTPMLSIGVKLLLLSLVWVALYYLQSFLVGKRRCSRDWYVQYTAMAAYYLPTPVALCAASALYHFPSSHIHEYTTVLVFGIIFMLYLTIFFSTHPGLLSTNIRAYSLGDRPRDRSALLMWLVFLGSKDWRGLEHPVWWYFPFCLLYLTAFGILFIKPQPESTLDCQTKAVADYMKRRKSSKSSSTSSPFFDVMSNDDADSICSLQLLDYCKYPFVKGKEGEWITVQDLFDQCGNLSDGDKEICLSYSLSGLLARRYYGFHCAEEGDDIVRRFVLADLGRRDGYDRAFRIVEVQLAFLHDYFFTNSFTNIKSGFRSIIKYSRFLWLGFGVIILSFLIAIKIQNELPHMIEFFGGVLAICLIWCGVFWTPMSFLVKYLVASYWRPIHTAFHNLKCLSDGSLPIIDPFQTEAGGAYWSNKIGQYSILQDFNRHRSLKKEIVAWFKGTILSEPSYRFIKHLPVEDEEIDIKNLDSMRKLVADTLKAIDGPPTNGSRSIKINRDSAGYDWSWTCRQHTHTHTILIWHIATCYCDMSRYHSDRLDEEFPLLVETETFHEVATALSRYCAYLVAFLPEFLPEHSLINNKEVFQNVIQDAQDALGSTRMEDKEKHTKIRKLKLLPRRYQTTFDKGVRLGRQLEKLNTRLRWKVMAEFWAETILYIAPSDNAEAHIEHLAKGGEFITHLWAMLSNAGILKRATEEWHPPPASTTTPPASTTTGELCSSSRGPLTQTEITDVQTQGSIVPSNDEAPACSRFSSPRLAILHFWAMLSNAGILKRATEEWHPPPASTTTGGPLTQTEITNVQTQGSIVPSNDEAPAPSTASTPSSHRGQPSKYTAEEFRSINKV